jgi:hypothetical protein
MLAISLHSTRAAPARFSFTSGNRQLSHDRFLYQRAFIVE